jgi:hypothetical protein
MFERSERSERSEFSDGHESENRRGAFSVAEAAASARWALPGCGFAAETAACKKPAVQWQQRAESERQRLIF